MRRPTWKVAELAERGDGAAGGHTQLLPPSSRASWMPSFVQMSSEHRPGEFDTTYHAPVMVAEVLHYLQPVPGGLYVDGTLGGGGHSAAILKAADGARVIAGDQDRDALAESRERLSVHGDRFRAVESNFADLVHTAGIQENSLDGVLLDLGISSHQIDVDSRGFTFRSGAPLDMRMASGADADTAADFLNQSSEGELANAFYRWGDEKRSGRLARELIRRREAQPLASSDDLVGAINEALPRATVQDHARIFQAVRIAVNREIDVLRTALPRFRDALRPGGVLVVISYHSVEDRVVKDDFREWSRDCICPPGLPICACRGEALGKTLTRKPVMAGEAEIAANPRARSGRLRAWRKE